MIWALLIGCGPQCADGENVTAEGDCVPQGQALGWDETTLPGYRLRECSMTPGDGAFDLFTGCAHGVCRDDTYDDFVATLGAPDETEGLGSLANAHWDGIALYAYFADDDGDSRPDGGAIPEWMSLHDRASGTSTEGLRVGISFACFVQVLGPPTDVDTENDVVTSMRFDDHAVWVSDYTGDQSFLDPDGYVDTIAIDDVR